MTVSKPLGIVLQLCALGFLLSAWSDYQDAAVETSAAATKALIAIALVVAGRQTKDMKNTKE